MLVLTEGTTPKGLQAGPLPGGEVAIGNYVISAADFDRLVKEVGSSKTTRRGKKAGARLTE